MDLLKAEAPPYTFGHHQQAVVVHILRLALNVASSMSLQRGVSRVRIPSSRERRAFISAASKEFPMAMTSLLPSSGYQGSSRLYKFIKRPFGNLHHAVVQSGLKACVGLARHSVFDLVKAVSDGNLCGHLGYWIARSLGC